MAIREKPEYAEAHYTLGTGLKQMAKLPVAAQALREAVSPATRLCRGAYRRWQRFCANSETLKGLLYKAKVGIEVAKQKNALQMATFTTNLGRRLLDAGDLDWAVCQFQNAIRFHADLRSSALSAWYRPAAKRRQRTGSKGT